PNWVQCTSFVQRTQFCDRRRAPGSASVGSAPVARRAVSSLVPVLLAALVLTGCGGPGSRTDCGLDGCTVTFPRSGAVAVSVLGVEARLAGVQNGTARLEIA